MRRLILILSCSLLPLLAAAQSDSLTIGQQILNYTDTKEDYIQKGRRMLADRFEQMDWETVKQIMDYFAIEIDDHEHLSLWPAERIMLYYWTRQYNSLIDYLPTLENDQQHEYSPADSHIGEVVMNWAVRDFDILNDWIDQSELSAEDNDFLKLLLEMMLADNLFPKITQEQLNHQADTFIEQYPYSKYVDFTKKHISFKTGLSNWGFGFGLGGGYTFHNNDYLNPKGAIFMDINFRYKRWMFDMVILGGFGKLKQDIPDTEWLKGDNASPACIGLSLGYDVVKSNKIRITPFAGVSFNGATPNEKLIDEYPSLEDVSLDGFSALLGFKLDWRIFSSYSQHVFSPATLYNINLNVSYLPGTFNKAGHIYSGNMLFVTAGFSFDLYRIKRVN